MSTPTHRLSMDSQSHVCGRTVARCIAGGLWAASMATGCGGTTAATSPSAPATPDPWAAVTAAILAAQGRFSGGLAVEVLTPAGVVNSRTVGGFATTTFAPVASASKMVSASVFLRLVEQGTLSLDAETRTYLVNRQGQPWSGNIGRIRLRHLLSFTSGISSDVASSEDATITLTEAVARIYDDQSPTASLPGSYFYYGGSTHLRIAARMAEIATGKTWRQLFDEQLRVPLGWGVLRPTAARRIRIRRGRWPAQASSMHVS